MLVEESCHRPGSGEYSRMRDADLGCLTVSDSPSRGDGRAWSWERSEVRRLLILVGVVMMIMAMAVPAIGAPPAKVQICHFPGHVDPTNPAQIDFVLDLGLTVPEREAECTDLNGKILTMNVKATSWSDSEFVHGHVLDPSDR